MIKHKRISTSEIRQDFWLWKQPYRYNELACWCLHMTTLLKSYVYTGAKDVFEKNSHCMWSHIACEGKFEIAIQKVTSMKVKTSACWRNVWLSMAMVTHTQLDIHAWLLYKEGILGLIQHWKGTTHLNEDFLVTESGKDVWRLFSRKLHFFEVACHSIIELHI